MTVEAAAVLPLFLFFFLHLGSAMEMIRLHGMIAFALWDAGRELVSYQCAEDALGFDLPDPALSYLVVQRDVEKILGRDALDHTVLRLGRRGLNYLGSDYDDDCIHILVTYEVKPPYTVFPFFYHRMANQYYAKAWTGYDVRGTQQEIIYVTEYGEVWHATMSCTYLHPQIREVSGDAVLRLRNENGERYTACAYCTHGICETMYVTTDGNRYHADRSCSSLVRRIHAVSGEQKGGYRPCSRCVGNEGG